MDALIISQHSDRIHGIPRYATELSKRLEDAKLLRYNVPKNSEAPNSNWVQRNLPDTPAPVAVGKFIKHPVELTRRNADIYHAADPREILPIWMARRKPLVTTVHDLIVYEFSEAFKRRWTYLSRFYLQFLKYSDRIIAVSESTKQDAIDRLNIDPEKIDVVYHGIDNRFEPLSSKQLSIDLKDGAVLMVGRPQPRKNHTGVADALGRLNEQGIGAHLYVVGANELDVKHLRDNIPQDEDHIHPTGYVDDETLIEYYNAADVVAVPSYYEGFGFPVLEAMACGTPVVTSDRSCLPEVAGDAALTVDPDDPDAIAEGIKTVLTDREQSEALRRAGLKRAESFTWERTARETKRVYQRAIESFE